MEFPRVVLCLWYSRRFCTAQQLIGRWYQPQVAAFIMGETGIDNERSKTDGNNDLDVADPKKIHKCSYPGCSAAFGRPHRLEQHVRVHTGQRPFVCSRSGCGKSYTRAAHLKRHEELSHEKIFEPLIKCTATGCEEMFTSEFSQRRHYTRIHENRSFVCEHCSARFLKHQHLKIHLHEHTGVKPFTCPHEGCGKSFLLPSKLKSHSKSHSGYSCRHDSCDERFPNWTLLRKHVASAHSKDHSCKHCSRSFSTKSLLKDHLLTHEKEREIFHCPFEECDRKYLYGKNLAEHIKAFHEKQYKCQDADCQKSFLSFKAYKKHMTLHKSGPPPPKQKSPAKKRATRKDKGSVKKSMASKLTGIILPSEMEKRLIHGI